MPPDVKILSNSWDVIDALISPPPPVVDFSFQTLPPIHNIKYAPPNTFTTIPIPTTKTTTKLNFSPIPYC